MSYRVFAAACAVSSCFSASIAHAQTRPLQTEEATTGAAGGFLLDTGLDFIKDEPNFITGKPRDRYDGPLLRVVYSPSNNVEMDLEWVSRISTPHDPDFGSVSDAGDVTMRTKLRVYDGGDRLPTFAVRFWVTWAETRYEQALGPNTLRSAAQGLVTIPVDRVRFHVNAGFGLDDDAQKLHLQSDFLVYGLAGEWRAQEHLALLAELAGRTGSGHPGTDKHSELRAGVRVGGPKLTADAALRRGLGDADGKLGFTVGLSVALRRSPPK
jgi:hypothetical protein